MDIMVRIPDDVARRLGTAGELERRALEALAAEEYRLGHLTATELRRLLGFEAEVALDAFLKVHGLSEAAPGKDSRAAARAAAARIRAMSRGVTLGGLKLKDLISEGRVPTH
jgi:hypothetical protein